MTPLLRIDLDEGNREYNIGNNIRFTSIGGLMRGQLLEGARAAKSSGRTLKELSSAGALLWLAVPEVAPLSDSPRMRAAAYRAIANAIAGRLMDCVQLLHEITPLGKRKMFCWLVRMESGSNATAVDMAPLEPDWSGLEPEHMDPGYLDGLGEATPGWVALELLDKFKARLLPVCQIERLNALFSDPAKQQGYVHAANSNVQAQVERFISELADQDRGSADPQGAPTIQIPGRMTAKWFIEGWLKAQDRDLEKFESALYSGGHAVLFDRAFGIYSRALELHRPYRFVFLCNCLEALLGNKSQTDLTYQLATRAAWLLEPESNAKRLGVFDRIRELYNFRSKIVHGSQFKME